MTAAGDDQLRTGLCDAVASLRKRSCVDPFTGGRRVARCPLGIGMLGGALLEPSSAGRGPVITVSPGRLHRPVRESDSSSPRSEATSSHPVQAPAGLGTAEPPGPRPRRSPTRPIPYGSCRSRVGTGRGGVALAYHLGVRDPPGAVLPTKAMEAAFRSSPQSRPSRGAGRWQRAEMAAAPRRDEPLSPGTAWVSTSR
jgi:hypothetical protein